MRPQLCYGRSSCPGQGWSRLSSSHALVVSVLPCYRQARGEIAWRNNLIPDLGTSFRLSVGN